MVQGVMEITSRKKDDQNDEETPREWGDCQGGNHGILPPGECRPNAIPACGQPCALQSEASCSPRCLEEEDLGCYVASSNLFPCVAAVATGKQLVQAGSGEAEGTAACLVPELCKSTCGLELWQPSTGIASRCGNCPVTMPVSEVGAHVGGAFEDGGLKPRGPPSAGQGATVQPHQVSTVLPPRVTPPTPHDVGSPLVMDRLQAPPGSNTGRGSFSFGQPKGIVFDQSNSAVAGGQVILPGSKSCSDRVDAQGCTSPAACCHTEATTGTKRKEMGSPRQKATQGEGHQGLSGSSGAETRCLLGLSPSPQESRPAQPGGVNSLVPGPLQTTYENSASPTGLYPRDALLATFCTMGPAAFLGGLVDCVGACSEVTARLVQLTPSERPQRAESMGQGDDADKKGCPPVRGEIPTVRGAMGSDPSRGFLMDQQDPAVVHGAFGVADGPPRIMASFPELQTGAVDFSRPLHGTVVVQGRNRTRQRHYGPNGKRLRGVSLTKSGKYRAQSQIPGAVRNLGSSFSSAEAAAHAYDRFLIQRLGAANAESKINFSLGEYPELVQWVGDKWVNLRPLTGSTYLNGDGDMGEEGHDLEEHHVSLTLPKANETEPPEGGSVLVAELSEVTEVFHDNTQRPLATSVKKPRRGEEQDVGSGAAGNEDGQIVRGRALDSALDPLTTSSPSGMSGSCDETYSASRVTRPAPSGPSTTCSGPAPEGLEADLVLSLAQGSPDQDDEERTGDEDADCDRMVRGKRKYYASDGRVLRGLTQLKTGRFRAKYCQRNDGKQTVTYVGSAFRSAEAAARAYDRYLIRVLGVEEAGDKINFPFEDYPDVVHQVHGQWEVLPFGQEVLSSGRKRKRHANGGLSDKHGDGPTAGHPGDDVNANS